MSDAGADGAAAAPFCPKSIVGGGKIATRDGDF